MNKKIYASLFSSSLFFLLSCEKDKAEKDVNPNITEERSNQIEIVDFKIQSNNSNGLVLQTNFSGPENLNTSIYEYGVIWESAGIICSQPNTSKISSISNQVIKKGLSKGVSYSIYPYLQIEKKTSKILGNKISFNSQIDSNFEITSVEPNEGFANDTLTIKGIGFCAKSRIDTNFILLDNSIQNVFFQSDTLIKAKINSFLEKSKLKVSIKSCNIIKTIDKEFSINRPVFDSISKKEVFTGESFFIYGKNLHSDFSDVEIEGISAQIVDNDFIDKLEVIVPNNIPPGLLDIKLKVLDRTLEKKDIFFSTTPLITEVFPREIHYNDTFTIKGDFFDQRNKNGSISIGGIFQSIISKSNTEIVVKIDKVIFRENPDLNLTIGSHILTNKIKVLPPEIIDFDNESFDLDGNLKIKLNGYIKGAETKIEVGNNKVTFFEYDEIKKEISVSLTPHFNLQFTGVLLQIENGGEIPATIYSPFGSSTKRFKVNPPKIVSLDKTEYSIGEELIINGINFGNFKHSKIVINDEVIGDEYRQGVSKPNLSSKIWVPDNLSSGKNTIAVITAGQKSNNFNFFIAPSSVSDFFPKRGTRKTVFKVTGTNLGIGGEIYINDKIVKIIDRNENEIFFKLNERGNSSGFFSIKYHYGSEVTNLGILEVVEPFTSEDFLNVSGYEALYASTFTYNKTPYFVNRNGFYKFNFNSNSFTRIDIPLVDEINFDRKIFTVKNDKLYIPGGKKIKVYDFLTKKWSDLHIDFNNDAIRISQVTSLGNYLFLLVTDTPGFFPKGKLFKYNLDSKNITELNLPEPDGRLKTLYSFEGKNKMIYKSRGNSFYAYELDKGFWENLHYPTKGSIHYSWDYSVYLHENILYISGGLHPGGSAQPWDRFNCYNFNTGKWIEKTSLLRKKSRHSTIERNGKLYFLIGTGEFTSHTNTEILIYDIAKDL